MSIEKTNFDDINETDLQELVEGEVPEGIRIEYKRDFYKMGKKGEQSEARKDISAFMNAHGGHLVLGMDEEDGVATELCGLSANDPDTEQQWLTNILNSGIEPRILPRIKSIPLENGNHAIIIRIPNSWAPPHRALTRKGWKFIIRNSSGKHEASMQELRDLFTMSSGIIEKIQDFQENRVEIMNRAIGGRPLFGSGQLILHIVPVSAFTTRNQLNLDVALENYKLFFPLEFTSCMPRVNFDGLLLDSGYEHNFGYTQIFRNGILETTRANLVQEREGLKLVSGTKLENQFFQRLPGYIEGLKLLEVPTPLVILITLRGMDGVEYAVRAPAEHQNDWERIDRKILDLPECIIEDYGVTEEYSRAVQPAFDALWNAAGYKKSYYYNEDNVWVGAH